MLRRLHICKAAAQCPQPKPSFKLRHIAHHPTSPATTTSVTAMDSSSESQATPPRISTPLASQVGGHAGITTTEDGSLIIKPALPAEAAFYTALQRAPELAPLLPFVPQCIGTLTLQGSVQDGEASLLDAANGVASGVIVAAPDGPQKDESCFGFSGYTLVLENVSHGFERPNILDVKLGTVLYAPDASPDKVARMERTARETTSLETGVRLTGFQVYDNTTGLPVNTPKSYGKSIRPAQLPEGIARFFPVGDADSNASSPERLAASSGLPRTTLIRMLRAIREDVQEIRDALSAVELRMVGGSLLIVYEADWARAAEAVDKYLGGNADSSSEDEDDDDDKEGEGDEDSDSEDGNSKLALPFQVKLIDFAHTRLTPGEGPDEGVLKGLDTVLSLLDGRLETLGPLSPPPLDLPKE